MHTVSTMQNEKDWRPYGEGGKSRWVENAKKDSDDNPTITSSS